MGAKERRSFLVNRWGFSGMACFTALTINKQPNGMLCMVLLLP